MEKSFMEMLVAKQIATNSLVCVGLDSEFGKIPAHVHRRVNREVDVFSTMLQFNVDIVLATHDVASAYKANLGFYLKHGSKGIDALARTIVEIRIIDPDMPIILDGKSGDIDSTNIGYTDFAFKYLGVDGMTIHPYLGGEASQSFLDYKNKGIFVLCRTSNKGSGEFQDLLVPVPGNAHHIPNYQYVAHRVVNEWNENGNCGLVVGATYPAELAKVRAIVGRMPILVPGIGAQGGDIEATVKAGIDSDGRGIVVNSSRGIIFKSNGSDFAEAARSETMKLRDAINQFR